MRKIDYESPGQNTGNTETQIAVDETPEKKYGNLCNAYEEGFASGNGIRGNTDETDVVRRPDRLEDSHPERVADSIEDENLGLIDG
jgi:hypothetical protein